MIMGIFNRIVGQRDIGKTWGYVSQVSSQMTIFITVINLFMLAATFYQTTFGGWMQDRGWYCPFWMFMVILIVLLGVTAVLVFKYAVPSFFNAFNDQFYKHNNLLRKDIDEIKALLKNLEKK